MNNLFDDLELLEHFYDSSYITLEEYYEIKERIINKFKKESEKKTNENN